MTVTGGSGLTVREMLPSEARLRVDYFHDASDEHLVLLGVDRSRLPGREQWLHSYAQEHDRPLPQRDGHALVWELDSAIVGFSTADNIDFGDHAFMHLHIVDPQRRHRGLGARFVQLSAVRFVRDLELHQLYCRPNALNIPPNRTLQRAGFRYDRGEYCRPGRMNTLQVVTRWVVDRDTALHWT